MRWIVCMMRGTVGTFNAPLLKVVYADEHGATDAMAWQVRDLSGWMRQINETRSV
jgi:hypothetical protein